MFNNSSSSFLSLWCGSGEKIQLEIATWYLKVSNLGNEMLKSFKVL